MTKLPINLLLTLGILSLLGAIGMQFKGLLDDRKRHQGFEPAGEQKLLGNRWENGQLRAGETVVGPNYGARLEDFWDDPRTANLIGKVPEKPKDVGAGDVPDQPVEPQEVPQTPLEDIFTIVCIVFDGDGSQAIIQYKPESNVKPPADVVAANVPLRGGPADTIRGRTRPGTSRNPRGTNPRVPGGRGAVAMPGAPAGGVYTQQLRVGERLWEDYQHIKLVRVADDASHAIFVREDPAKPEDEWEEEPLYPEVLGLQQDVLSALEGGQPSRPVGTTPRAAPVESTGWQPTETTREVATNRFHVGTRDSERFRTNGQRLFNEDIGTANWRSRFDGRSGVQVTRVSQELSGYGVQAGDIILSVNGEAVSSKAQAISVGKRLHRNGVRTFQVEFLSGGRTVTRTYVAPD